MPRFDQTCIYTHCVLGSMSPSSPAHFCNITLNKCSLNSSMGVEAQVLRPMEGWVTFSVFPFFYKVHDILALGIRMNRSIHAVSMTLFYVQSTHAKEQWGVHHRASLSRNSTQSEFHLSGAGKVEDANENRWSLGFTQTTSWNTKAQTIIGYGICNLEMQLFFFF